MASLSIAQNAHIAKQNFTGDQFALLSSQLQLHQIGLPDFSRQISGLSNDFVTFAVGLGYPRALQGANDIYNLARQLIRDQGGDDSLLIPPGSFPAQTVGGPVNTGTAGALLGQTQADKMLTIALIAGAVIFLFLLLRKKA